MLVFVQGAFAQGVPRIKATVQSLDGQILTVTTGAGKDVQTVAVELLPSTQIVREEKRAAADIAVGSFIGATVTGKDGVLRAQEVHIFPEVLRGAGEGLVPADSGRSMIGAAVTAVAASGVSVAYRGTGTTDGPACTGRAPRPAGAATSAGCRGTAIILVAPDAPVTALLTGDKSLLAPGALVAVSVMAGSDGRLVTPGLTVMGQSAPVPAPLPAKPAGK